MPYGSSEPDERRNSIVSGTADSKNTVRGEKDPVVRRGLAMAMLVSACLLSGCLLPKTRTVQQTVLAPDVKSATPDELLANLDRQDKAIQTMSATVEITATTGGVHGGEEKEYTSLTGYIFLRRPADLRMLMLLPVVRSRALDMVTDGDQFKLLITFPGKKLAITGKDEYTTGSKNGLENIRPYIIRDALLIPAASPEEYITPTEASRVLPAESGKKVLTEEPDYDITISRITNDHHMERVRVIHFGRLTLKPYQQDIYHQGRIVTSVTYGKYQHFNDLDYPTEIVITRPLDEYKLKIDVTKLVLNGAMADDEFILNLPSTIPVRKM